MMDSVSFVVVEEFLESVGAKSALSVFRENAIDDDVLPLLTEEQLRALNLPLGVQIRVWNGLKERFHSEEITSNKNRRREKESKMMKRRKHSKDDEKEEEDEDDDEEEEEEVVEKKLLRKERAAERRAGSSSSNTPGFFKKWMPSFVIVASFSPLLVYLVHEVIRDAMDGTTNFVFVTVAFLVLVVVIGLCAFMQFMWWAYLKGTGPVEFLGALCAPNPELDF